MSTSPKITLFAPGLGDDPDQFWVEPMVSHREAIDFVVSECFGGNRSRIEKIEASPSIGNTKTVVFVYLRSPFAPLCESIVSHAHLPPDGAELLVA